MKHTIISCDLCNGCIYCSGWFQNDWDGAISISARVLRNEFTAMDKNGKLFTYPGWRRRRYHICGKCVEIIKNICKGQNKEGELKENDQSNSPSEGR